MRTGFDLQNWPDLLDAVRRLAAAVDAAEDGTNDYGTFYRVESVIEGPGAEMPLQLYDRVALRASVPEHALRAGDVATLVDFVEPPGSGPRGCVPELFNALGESIGIVTVPEHAVEPLRADEVLSVRTLAIAR